jgi:cytochrome c2
MHLMMKPAIAFAVAAISLAPVIRADDYDEGVKHFYVQCYICHWSNNPEKAPRPSTGLQTDPLKGIGVEKAAWEPGLSPGPFLRVQNVYGPDLRGVYDSPAGRRAKEGYRHSEAFTKSAPSIVWNEQVLDLWMTNAQTLIPGSWMAIKIPDPEVRRVIIVFLKNYKE